jgi:STE24 endopeptidase
MTKCLFVTDWVKNVIMKFVIISFLILLFIWLANVSGDYLLLFLGFSTVWIVALTIILVPTVLIPCFYKLSDLEEGELKSRIEKESEKTKIEVSAIQIIDASKRSSKGNAFVYGMCCFKKIAIYDTLI